MATLFELSSEQIELLNMLNSETEDGLTNEEQERIIEEYIQADGNFKEKLDSYRYLIDEMEGRAAIAKAEADFFEKRAAQLKARSKANQGVADRLMFRIKQIMEMRGEELIETDKNRFALVSAGGKAPITYPIEWDEDPAQAPEEFHLRKIVIDKDGLRKALENKEDIPGCAILPRHKRLSIR